MAITQDVVKHTAARLCTSVIRAVITPEHIKMLQINIDRCKAAHHLLQASSANLRPAGIQVKTKMRHGKRDIAVENTILGRSYVEVKRNETYFSYDSLTKYRRKEIQRFFNRL